MRTTLPNIKEIWQAFSDYNAQIQRAIYSREYGKIKTAQDNLKKRLDEMGLGQHIDWRE